MMTTKPKRIRHSKEPVVTRLEMRAIEGSGVCPFCGKSLTPVKTRPTMDGASDYDLCYTRPCNWMRRYVFDSYGRLPGYFYKDRLYTADEFMDLAKSF